MSFEFAHAIDFELAGGIGGLEAPLAADARVHFKNGNLADVVVPPLHLLDGVGQGAKHALRRCGDMNFTNNGVEIRSDDGSWHVCSSLFSASCCAEILSRIRSPQKFSSWPDWRARRHGTAPARNQQLSAAQDSACKRWRPSLLSWTKCARRSRRRCLEIAGRETGNARAIWPAGWLPRRSRSSTARRVGSARA